MGGHSLFCQIMPSSSSSHHTEVHPAPKRQADNSPSIPASPCIRQQSNQFFKRRPDASEIIQESKEEGMCSATSLLNSILTNCKKACLLSIVLVSVPACLLGFPSFGGGLLTPDRPTSHPERPFATTSTPLLLSMSLHVSFFPSFSLHFTYHFTAFPSSFLHASFIHYATTLKDHAIPSPPSIRHHHEPPINQSISGPDPVRDCDCDCDNEFPLPTFLASA